MRWPSPFHIPRIFEWAAMVDQVFLRQILSQEPRNGQRRGQLLLAATCLVSGTATNKKTWRFQKFLSPPSPSSPQAKQPLPLITAVKSNALAESMNSALKTHFLED